jgi:phosphate transport system substrate-binding protein
MRILILTTLAFCLTVGPLAAQEKVILGGSGALQDAAGVLVKTYKQKHPTDAVDHMTDGMSTTGGIEATKIGRLTVGIITRHLNEKDKKDGLVYRPIARLAIVVGLHKSLPVNGLSDSQVCDVFSGKIKFWKEIGGGDGKIMVLGRSRDDNTMNVFREKMGCFKTIQLPADAVLLTTGSELMDALNNRPGTVAITVLAANKVHVNVKPLAVDGAAPTIETVKTGKYKYFNEIGFVTVGEPAGAVKRFVDFAVSSEGEKILEAYGMTGVR